MYGIVIHGCVLRSGAEVLATGERVVFYPSSKLGLEKDAFAKFGIEWDRGRSFRGHFLVKIGKKEQGVKHFSLVVDGFVSQVDRVGLRPHKGGKPDLLANVLWAQQNVEPRDWPH